MNRFLFCGKYMFIFLIINLFNTSALGGERSCLNYPYPEGIYLKGKFKNKTQLIYTKSVAIKSKNIRKIEFAKKKNNVYAITYLNNHIKLYFPNIKEEEIGIYNLYSCFDSEGTYKTSFAQRDVKLNIFQKLKYFIETNFIHN